MEILLTGNTGYVTNQFIEEAFPEDHVLIEGDCPVKPGKNILKIDVSQEKQKLLENYELDRIVYFSCYLTFHGEQKGEMENLRRLLRYSRGKNIQFLYMTGLYGSFTEKTGKTVLAESAEMLCFYYSEVSKIDMKILRLPFLYSATYGEDYFYQLFQRGETQGTVGFPAASSDPAYFLHIQDLSKLVYRIFDNWEEGQEILTVGNFFDITFGQIGDELQELLPSLSVNYFTEDVREEAVVSDRTVRERYGWFPQISLVEELPFLYEQYCHTKKSKMTWQERVLSWLRVKRTLWSAGETVCLFGGAEYLNRVLGNWTQFRFIDVRLLFVVICGSIYGINMGVLAAALSSLSLVYAYVYQGSNWQTLFYEPTNWLPFILYFTVGSICGYIKMYSKNQLELVTRENHLLKEKFYFVQDLYRDAFQEKRELKRQILGSKDSFGKVFEVTKRLDSVKPQEIFMKTIYVMEDILENQTIAIYSFGKNPYFARLEAASRNIADFAPNSLRVEDYKEEISQLEQTGVWVNRELDKKRPAYMVGVYQKERLVLLVTVSSAKHSQMTLYYENLLKILCGLVETTLLRAMEYQATLYEKQHVNGRLFMKEEYFREKIALCRSMREEKIMEFTILRLKGQGRGLEEIEDIVGTMIRENDTLGLVGEKELYLLLHQTARGPAAIVQKRLRKRGLETETLSMEEEEAI